MKETGIRMFGNHPKLILDGQKTQTPRVIKPQPKPNSTFLNLLPNERTKRLMAIFHKTTDTGFVQYPRQCSYGQVGDRLWVRETWRILDNTMKLDDEVRVEYKADGQIVKRRYGDIIYNEAGIRLPVIDSAMEDGKWEPAHHLPHIIYRITLEITEVRVERIQDISADDVKAEGIPSFTLAKGVLADEPPDPRWAFINFWNSFNAKRGYSWESNPWVWVISFKLIKPTLPALQSKSSSLKPQP